MQKTIFAFFLTVLLVFCFSQEQKKMSLTDTYNRFSAASSRFQQAAALVRSSGDNEIELLKADSLYRESLRMFTNLTTDLMRPGNDSLLFLSKISTGYIHYYFDSLEAAQKDYRDAIALKQTLRSSIADSLLFLPYLYTGAAFYTQNRYDSALFYYKKAEQLNDSYAKPLNESQRLFNRLGVMLYETGNYYQARNYFEKAILVHEKAVVKDNSLIANYRINIASILVKLEEYDTARKIYEGLLTNEAYRNEINHNLGIIYLKQQDPRKAISYFRKVNYTEDRKSAELNYNFALVHAALGNNDSADLWVHRAIAENIRWNGHQKNTLQGLIFKFQGDMAAAEKKFREAAVFYQDAIQQLAPSFSETDILKNPESFVTASSYINLFNTLSAKADVLQNIYDAERKITWLEGALGTYEAAFKLADYVSKTYDSDESRLFLNKIKHIVHNKPISISLKLFELSQNKDYLNAAYQFDQRNKASILSQNVHENELQRAPGTIGDLLRDEARIKAAITRVALKTTTQTDSATLQQLFSSIRDNEIELGKIREKINSDPVWQQRNAAEQIPPVSELQKKLDPYSALLSYHLSENGLLVLIITSSTFEYQQTDVSQRFYADIESLKNTLQHSRTDERYTGTEAATNLYRQLISPVAGRLSQKKRLIIIPDDELNYLPFEALQANDKKYLVEQFAIQYQFATSLVMQPGQQFSSPGILAMAPFASHGFEDENSQERFNALPASKEEVSSLNGTVLRDSIASKVNFLQMANHFGIVHLATHASVNNENPDHSYIAFYPGQPDYKLYAREIYDLHLDSTRLVILSACETGAGQLVKGEGLMSLSRAFTYAGCPNIITSLWKAEDKATAFLTSRLYYYLERKNTKDEALQLAKLDLLRSNDIDPRLKSPRFWAHLIYIGNYEAEQKGKNWWWIAVVIIIGAVVYKLIGLKNAQKKKG